MERRRRRRRQEQDLLWLVVKGKTEVKAVGFWLEGLCEEGGREVVVGGGLRRRGAGVGAGAW